MTTLVIARIRVNGDIEELRKKITPDLQATLERTGLPDGVKRHRTFASNGEVIIVDEWDRPEQFQAWMNNPEVQRLLSEVAAGQPEVTFAEQVELGDEVG
jgi:quinol monooxygenase YgiN